MYADTISECWSFGGNVRTCISGKFYLQSNRHVIFQRSLEEVQTRHKDTKGQIRTIILLKSREIGLKKKKSLMFWTYNCVWWFAPPWLLLLLDARCVHGPLHSEFSGASTTIAVQRASLNASFHLRARPSFRRRRTTCARDAAARSVVARHTRTQKEKA